VSPVICKGQSRVTVPTICRARDACRGEAVVSCRATFKAACRDTGRRLSTFGRKTDCYKKCGLSRGKKVWTIPVAIAAQPERVIEALGQCLTQVDRTHFIVMVCGTRTPLDAFQVKYQAEVRYGKVLEKQVSSKSQAMR